MPHIQNKDFTSHVGMADQTLSIVCTGQKQHFPGAPREAFPPRTSRMSWPVLLIPTGRGPSTLLEVGVVLQELLDASSLKKNKNQKKKTSDVHPGHAHHGGSLCGEAVPFSGVNPAVGTPP